MTFKTSSSGGGYRIPTYVAVYSGDSLSSIVRLAFSTTRDSNYVTSLEIEVEQGATYRIVGATGASRAGSFTFQWSGDLTVEKTPYEEWAESPDVNLGGPEEVTGGVENAFRYVFDVPAAPFAPIQSVSVDASGHPVVSLPPIVNTDGVTLTIQSTDRLTNWSPSAVSERPVTGATMTLDDDGPVRFFRLKADVE